MKRVLFFMAFVMLAFTNIFAASYDVEVDGIYYKKGTNKLTVVAGPNEYSGDIIIPEMVAISSTTTLPVLEIGSKAFYNCTYLQSVTIGNNVLTIGKSAFSGCTRLMTINFGNGLKDIGDYAFAGCNSIIDLWFPGSLTTISTYAFRNCTSLKNITFNDGDGEIEFASIIEEGTPVEFSGTYFTPKDYYAGCQFSGCNSIKNVYVGKDINYRDDNTKDNDTAEPVLGFENCSSITSITIGESVTAVKCFKGCENITSVLSKIEDPTQCQIITLGQNSYDNAVLTVPKGTSNVYSTTGEWSKFANIVEQRDVFSLNVTCGEGGSICFCEAIIQNETQSFEVLEDEEIQLTITPDESHLIGSVTVNGEDYTANIVEGVLTLRMPTDNVNVVVAFTQKTIDDGKHILTITVDNHGKVVYDENVVSDGTATFRVDDNASVTLRVVPALGYRVALAMLNSVDITDMLVDGTYSIKRMRADMIFEVEFEVAPATLTISMADRGSVTMDALSGSTYEFTITPASDWGIHSVTFDGEDITASVESDGRLTTPVVTGDAVLTIAFEFNGQPTMTRNLTDVSLMRVWAQGSVLHIDNAPLTSDIEVFTVDGLRLYSLRGKSHRLELQRGEVYIVKCGSKTVKIAI